jgi:GSH-dependent disulfide-bond oxidoreductase
MAQPLIYQRWPAKNPDVIQLYALNTPNGMKVSIALEEMELEYEPHTVNILEGDQFTEEFKSVNPNSKIPAILDPNGPGGKPLTIMESGAILIYLAEKSGKLMPMDPVLKNECMQWLFFQVGHVGPMFGQFGHFYKFANEKCKDPYPTERYATETRRLLAVIDHQLENKPYILGDEYTIADISMFPWVNTLITFYGAADYLKMNEYPKLQSWLKSCLERPASLEGSDVCSLN